MGCHGKFSGNGRRLDAWQLALLQASETGMFLTGMPDDIGMPCLDSKYSEALVYYACEKNEAAFFS